MTTEQMDNTDARRKREAAIGPVILYGTPSQGEIAQARGAGRGVLVLPEEMRNEGALLANAETSISDQEEHTHYTDRARVICAGGDHESAELWDREAEQEKIAAQESEETTVAEEPINDRLRRAWLNGFKEGVERASYSASESWGRWDS